MINLPDFLAAAPNLARLEGSVLFQHNVETLIWERHWRSAADPLRRFYFRLQARKMSAYEREVCRRVAAWCARDNDGRVSLYRDGEFVGAQPIRLKQGKNVIRGAVINGPGMSDFCARFVDESGSPISAATASAESPRASASATRPRT